MKEILFWIFLIFGLILLIWSVFGKSPTEFIALVALIFTVLLKTWSINDRQIKFEMKLKNLENNFIRLANDFKKQVKYK